MSADAPYLEVLDGELQGTQFRLLGETISVGRGADCHINLDGVRGVSRNHAQILLIDGRIRVRDMGSQNGTLVEGKRITDAVIGDGSTLKFGEVRLRLRVPPPQPPQATPNALAAGSESPLAETADGALAVSEEDARAARGNDKPATANAGRPVDATFGTADTSRGLIFLLLVVGLIGIFYAASVLLSVERSARPQQALLNKGDTRVIPMYRSFASIEVRGKTEEGGTIVSANEYDGWLKKDLQDVNERNYARGRPALWFVVARAQSWGDTVLVLKNSSGTPIRTIEVIVRGINSNSWESPPDPATVEAQADRLIRDARQLELDGELYSAIRLYERAAQLVSRELREEKRAFEIDDRARGLRLELKGKLESLFREAMLSAFPPENAPGRRSLQTAFDSLAAAKRLLNEDEENLEWQVLDHWQAEIRRLARGR